MSDLTVGGRAFDPYLSTALPLASTALSGTLASTATKYVGILFSPFFFPIFLSTIDTSMKKMQNIKGTPPPVAEVVKAKSRLETLKAQIQAVLNNPRFNHLKKNKVLYGSTLATIAALGTAYGIYARIRARRTTHLQS